MFFDRKTVALAQILAAKEMASRGLERLTEAYHQAQKTALFAGRSRTYHPFADAPEERLPEQREQVQASVHEAIGAMLGGFAQSAEWHLAREFANLDPEARADVVLDGETLLAAAPTPALLALEKQIVHLITGFKALPVLDPAHRWTWDAANGLWQSEVTESQRTRKQARVVTKAEATDKHPAQAEIFHEDVAVGRYEDRLFASKLTATQRRTLVEQAERLLGAVRDAQQRANGGKVAPERRLGPIASYLLKPFVGDASFPVRAE